MIAIPLPELRLAIRQTRARPTFDGDGGKLPRMPEPYGLAEVVGKWVWLDVSPARQPMLAKMLWPLGFQRNQRRGVWQHPCGKFDPIGAHPTDPRRKYRSFYPADVLPA